MPADWLIQRLSLRDKLNAEGCPTTEGDDLDNGPRYLIVRVPPDRLDYFRDEAERCKSTGLAIELALEQKGGDVTIYNIRPASI